MHTFGEVLVTDLRSLGTQSALVLVNLRKTLGKHSHWTHDEDVKGVGGMTERNRGNRPNSDHGGLLSAPELQPGPGGVGGLPAPGG